MNTILLIILSLVLLAVIIGVIVYFVNREGYKNNNSQIPKNIWIFWDKGWANAPKICKLCLDSWKIYNPTWKIHILDKQNIYNYLPKQFLDELWTKNQIQTQSDILRLNLLKKYGGIWVDATLYCNQSLDDWIYEYLNTTNFFVFQFLNDKRMISSWFIASTNDNYLINKFCNSYNSFWKNRTKSNDYFNCHHNFVTLYNTDKKFKKLFDSIKKFDTEYPHQIQFKFRNEITTSEKKILNNINNEKVPCFKLNRNTNLLHYSLFEELLNKTKSVHPPQLHFIHIPKTGGTSIENAGKKHNINWGRFYDYNDRKYNCSIWHQPTQPEYKSNNTFCVVRNPYTRMISEYHYSQGTFNNCKQNTPNRLTHFKKWLKKYANNYKNNKSALDCHLIPQTEYTQHCDHILRFENLEKEVNQLFKQYDLDYITLSKDNQTKKKCLKLSDLDKECKDIIYTLYKSDFDNFGYKS